MLKINHAVCAALLNHICALSVPQGGHFSLVASRVRHWGSASCINASQVSTVSSQALQKS